VEEDLNIENEKKTFTLLSLHPVLAAYEWKPAWGGSIYFSASDFF